MDIRSKIFGYVLGDGWIDIKGNGGISGERQSLQNIINDIEHLYGVNTTGQIRTEQTYSPLYNIAGTTSQCTIKTIVVKDLLSLGMPKGKRVLVDYQLPQWLLNGDYETKISFLSGYYAADGMIPSVQTNRETPRALSMCFYKSKELEDSGNLLAEQYQSIIRDLGFQSFISKISKCTGGPRIAYTITLDNQRDSFLKQLKALDLSYCIYREERRIQLIKYFELKQQKLAQLRSLKDSIFIYKEQNKTYKEISELTGLSVRQVGHILSGHNKCNRIVGFPKFDENFIRMCSSTKTPLNGETLLTEQ